MSDVVKDFSELDQSTIDFSNGEWSWNFSQEKKSIFLVHTTQDENFRFHSITYPLPEWMLHIAFGLKAIGESSLKNKLRSIESQRSELDKKRDELLSSDKTN